MIINKLFSVVIMALMIMSVMSSIALGDTYLLNDGNNNKLIIEEKSVTPCDALCSIGKFLSPDTSRASLVINPGTYLVPRPGDSIRVDYEAMKPVFYDQSWEPYSFNSAYPPYIVFHVKKADGTTISTFQGPKLTNWGSMGGFAASYVFNAPSTAGTYYFDYQVWGTDPKASAKMISSEQKSFTVEGATGTPTTTVVVPPTGVGTCNGVPTSSTSGWVNYFTAPPRTVYKLVCSGTTYFKTVCDSGYTISGASEKIDTTGYLCVSTNPVDPCPNACSSVGDQKCSSSGALSTCTQVATNCKAYKDAGSCNVCYSCSGTTEKSDFYPSCVNGLSSSKVNCVTPQTTPTTPTTPEVPTPTQELTQTGCTLNVADNTYTCDTQTNCAAQCTSLGKIESTQNIGTPGGYACACSASGSTTKVCYESVPICGGQTPKQVIVDSAASCPAGYFPNMVAALPVSCMPKTCYSCKGGNITESYISPSANCTVGTTETKPTTCNIQDNTLYFIVGALIVIFLLYLVYEKGPKKGIFQSKKR